MIFDKSKVGSTTKYKLPIFLVFLSGCGVSNEFLMMADNNKPVYLAQCNYNHNSMADCFQEANKACSEGFFIISYNESKMPVVSTIGNSQVSGQTDFNANAFSWGNNTTLNGSATSRGSSNFQSTTFAGSWDYRQLIYVCK